MFMDMTQPHRRMTQKGLEKHIDDELMRTRMRGCSHVRSSRLLEFSIRLATWEMLLLVYKLRGKEIRSIGSLIEDVRCKPMTDRALYKFFEDQVVRGNITFETTGPARRRVGLAQSLVQELEDYFQRASLLETETVSSDLVDTEKKCSHSWRWDGKEDAYSLTGIHLKQGGSE